MQRQFKVSDRANFETIEAYEFYESRRENLGEDFLNELEICYKSIQLNYEIYKLVYKNFRQAKIKRFPFIILYSVDVESIIVTSVFHTSLNPNKKFI